LDFLWKTLVLLLVTALLQSLFARLRIDQTVGMWWRVGTILVLVQLLVIIGGQYLAPLIKPLIGG
jgi:NADH-quinone oxidoreductase subunit H